MRTFKFDKIIRDKLPQKMIDIGIKVNKKENLSQKEIIQYLKAKVVEEAQEVFDAQTQPELIEEIADLTEALQELLRSSSIETSQIEGARIAKKEAKGGFSNAIVVNTVDIDAEHEFAEYYSLHPKKYPEIL
tara:strand:+ start:1022 stop:1417 length:396 start_codon:yes stop_codon:yes gene_type:complete